MKPTKWQREKWALEERQRRVEEKKKRQEAKEKQEADAQAIELKRQESLKHSNKEGSIDWHFEELVQVCPKLRDYLAIKYPSSEVKYQVPFAKSDVYMAFERLMTWNRCWEVQNDVIKVRKVRDWKPQGKSALALFRSLAAHLFARYATPPFLWSAFWSPGSPRGDDMLLITAAVTVAQGGSLKQFIKTHEKFPQLTKNMQKDFLETSAEIPFVKAIRLAQLKNVGCSKRVTDALLEITWGQELLADPDEEVYALSVAQWFANQAMLDPAKIRPMCDYIYHMRNHVDTAGFPMKGRTAMSVLRGMEEWHAELHRTNARTRGYQGPQVFKSCGLKGYDWDFSRHTSSGKHIKEIWRIREILTFKELLDEGRRMRHCVGSYSQSIVSGRVSIWTLTKEDEQGEWCQLTIELENGTKIVRQAAGMCNRQPTATEQNMLNRWKGLF